MTTDIRGPWAQCGEKLAKLRAERQITAAELAEQADLPSVTWITEVEAGRRPVPSVFFAPLAREYNVSLRDFAILCLSHYDQKAYQALFGSDVADAPMKAAA